MEECIPVLLAECDRGREQRDDSRLRSLFTRIKDLQQLISLFDFLYELRSLPDPSVASEDGITLLQAVVINKRPQLIQAFVLLGCWSTLVEQRVHGGGPYQGQTAEAIAGSLGLLQARDTIRECQKWEESLTPALKAARSGRLEELKELVAAKGQVLDDCDAMNYTVDFWALTGGNIAVIEYIIGSGRLTKTDRQGRNFLHLALYAPTEALNRVLDAVQEEGVLRDLINKRDLYSERGQYKVLYGRMPMSEELLEDLWKVFRVDRNLLGLFRMRQTLDSVEKFAKMKFQGPGDELDEKSSEELEKLKSRVDRNADRTPLHYATSVGNYEMARELLSHDADVDEKDGCGMTVLHVAAMYGDMKLVDLLLSHNASKDLVDKTVATAEQVAKDNLHLDVAEQLSTPWTLKMACYRKPVSTENDTSLPAALTAPNDRATRDESSFSA